MAYRSDCLVEEGPESESLLFNFEGPKPSANCESNLTDFMSDSE